MWEPCCTCFVEGLTPRPSEARTYMHTVYCNWWHWFLMAHPSAVIMGLEHLQRWEHAESTKRSGPNRMRSRFGSARSVPHHSLLPQRFHQPWKSKKSPMSIALVLGDSTDTIWETAEGAAEDDLVRTKSHQYNARSTKTIESLPSRSQFSIIYGSAWPGGGDPWNEGGDGLPKVTGLMGFLCLMFIIFVFTVCWIARNKAKRGKVTQYHLLGLGLC